MTEAEKELAAIVAWLRAARGLARHRASQIALEKIADAIERGAHRDADRTGRHPATGE